MVKEIINRSIAADVPMDTRPTCCGKPMHINSRVVRKSGKRIRFTCAVCGNNITVQVPD